MAKHIYVHIPFCEARCPYCSFFSSTADPAGYIDALLSEIRSLRGYNAAYNSDLKDTVYFGGGTPSALPAYDICRVLTAVCDKLEIASDAEKTIEVNPHSLTMEKALAYRRAGFNRVSVGVQSLSDEVLNTLGRLHDRRTALEALRIVREAGFTNISADLITGVPGQTPDMLTEHADMLIESGVKHISMYSLSIEEGTVFFERYNDTLEDLVPQEEERIMYHGLRDHLKDRGVIPYEISNCAFPGFESIHNGSYWRGLEYLGLGAGAHGFVEGKRYCHPDDIEDYVASPCSRVIEEELSSDDRMHEYAMLMLRTTDGINRSEFSSRFGCSLDHVFGDVIRSNIDAGLLEDYSSGVRLTSKGLDFANPVFADFL